MFNLSYSQEAEIKGTIKLDKPLMRLGPVRDIDGNLWDIHGIIGDYVQACPESGLHPFYSDTSNASYGFVSQTWHPYRIEVIN